LSAIWIGVLELGAVRGADLLDQLSSGFGTNDLGLVLAGLLAQLVLERAELLDRVVGDVEARRGSPPRSPRWRPLDHQDGLLGPGHDQVELGVVEEVLLVRLTTKLPSTLPMRTAPIGAGNGMSEIMSAAEARSWRGCRTGGRGSTEMGSTTSCVS